MASKQVIHTHTYCLLHLLISILLTCPFASCVLLPHTPIHLPYHKGALLAGDGPIKLHLTFYGDFTPVEKHAILSFVESLSGESTPSHIVEVSSASPQSESLNSLLPIEGSVRIGRRGLSSSKHSGLFSDRLKPSGFLSFKLRATASSSFSSSSGQEESGSSSKLSSEHGSSSKPYSEDAKASGFSSFRLKSSGFSPKELEASGFSFEQKASGSVPSEQKASVSSEAKGGRYSSFPRQKASGSSSSKLKASGSSSTVARWWSLTRAYTDLRGNPVSQTLLIEHQNSDNYSLGKLLSHSDIALLAKRSAGAASHDPLSLHIIITAADVGVEGFCMHACGQHAHMETEGELGRVAYAWVGNARDQCPGYCSWPFARAEYGPDMEPLEAPNSASADGMIINLAKVLVEAASNPYGDGYHAEGVGIGSVCTGVYGEGAFPGYPGHAYKDAQTGASFNAVGLHQSRFLLPYIWNPLTLSCAVHP
ncbi:hypothetical protein GOP47_0025110 [Adiantum capillus-veneris]|uniref:Uncharacterized protein n=1 Tax=Adiantum capillus-veneris TaxID=13818 RepID=A0A9D4U429_ADICA|nr:hypothetical protein GOP47_0025110 [Adiantum capillus-veneris]